MKVYFETLGCPKNIADSEVMKVSLRLNHIAMATFSDEADVVVVNTCAFIQDAIDESLSTIFDYVNKQKKVIVTGCLLARFKNKLQDELKEVQDWVSFEEQKSIAQIFKKNISVPENMETQRKILAQQSYAYVKIADGCNRSCAFCVIPLIKGSLHSRTYDSIVNEIRGLIEKGVREIILVAQDVTAFGKDNNQSLKILLEKIVRIKGTFFVRLLYLFPSDVDKELIDIIMNSHKIYHYFDIPVQHSSMSILKKMNRFYDKRGLFKLIDYIREKDYSAVVRTTLLVGFPGETQQDIDELMQFVKRVQFNHLGVFSYSREEGTPAYALGNSVHYKTKQKRVKDVMLLQQEISASLLAKFQNSIVEAIVDKKYDEVFYEARNYYFAPEIDGLIFVKSQRKLQAGDIIKVKITKTTEYDLYGEVI